MYEFNNVLIVRIMAMFDITRLYRKVIIRDGETGYVSFGGNGDRLAIDYVLTNQRHNDSKFVVGNFSAFYNSSHSEVNVCAFL